MKNEEITDTLIKLLQYDNIMVDDIRIIIEALNLYANRKLDFVDTFLYTYHKEGNHKIFTFDKKLNKLILTKVNPKKRRFITDIFK